ncbi:hypothetical protein AWB69_06913 [Caballeronia udeis]|uniref:Uncharacterized protein n=1 Tax=Caballeronia udeis TaxID=1232866 RepID=A0A158J0J0_9BURK|nr:hypothetical protein AWB69_06913 [Caballeronia udeis]
MSAERRSSGTTNAHTKSPGNNKSPPFFERQAFVHDRLSATGQIGNDGLVVVVTNRGADTLT